jgi:urocanase-like protein
VLPEITALDPASPVLRAYSCYRSLIEAAGNDLSPDQAFGGKLLYAGELDEEGRAITVAGNVAGCATLAATADSTDQNRAVREGIVDFLVNSFDEALRILKNEVRKHATVAVCVGVSTDDIERDTLDRGVQPDLTRADALEKQFTVFAARNMWRVDGNPMQTLTTVAWAVESLPAKWLPKFDALALESLQRSDTWNRRWIERAPRYLGRVGSSLRVVCADRHFATGFVERSRTAITQGDINTAAVIWIASDAGSEAFKLIPPQQPSI